MKKQFGRAEWTEFGDFHSVCGLGWVIRCLEILHDHALRPRLKPGSYEILTNVENIFIVKKIKYK